MNANGREIRGKNVFASIRVCSRFIIFFICVVVSRAELIDAKSATLDDLLYHAQRYGTTEEKRANKKAAQEELHARGMESLDYLMENIHLENVWIRILVHQFVEQRDADEVAEVLSSYLDSENSKTRKFAAYFMGYNYTPRYSKRLLPLLESEETAGAAIRTLGKWKYKKALPFIIPFLDREKERLRIMAINALRDIGHKDAVPHLIDALDDPVFTVRKTASRALVAIGKPAIGAVKKELESAPLRARWEMKTVLKER